MPSTTKQVYVKEADLPTWERAASIAKERGQPMSYMVARALETYLAALDRKDKRRAAR